jgi:choice-of-anchor B domain-containing protein
MIGVTGLFGQLNVSLISSLDYDETLNDIWGYVAPDGTEYALVGTTEGFSIVSLEDPENPEELHFIDGVTTVWRDIKTWGEFAYVVSDNSGEGMLIVDMTNLRADTVPFLYWQEPIEELGGAFLSSCHNLYIDEYGLLYLSGSNLGSIVTLDVKEDPWNPKFVVQTPGPYSHDVYVRDSIVYTSEIYDGRFFAYDISDVDSVVPLGGAVTPFNFTHNTWLSDDSKSLFTTDERANAFIGSYDISDWSNVRELDRYRPAATVGENVIPHNVHVLDDYLVISYYTDGLIVVDASRPDNLIEVGNYDTFLGANGGFSGAWGAYPFLPSGRVLVSDRQTGLYVLEPNYVRGCFLEGVVKDAITGDPVFGATVRIVADEILLDETADFNGNFKMGKAVPGTFTVEASDPEYYAGTVDANFENGVVTQIEIELLPREQYGFNGRVISQRSGEPVPGANVVIMNSEFMYEAQANAEGAFTFNEIYEGDYRLYAGNWGEYIFEEVEISSELAGFDILISPGYYDDFHFDYGWTESGNASNGRWVRDVPNPGTYFGFACNPSQDVTTDVGFSAFMTGNTGGDARDDSVEDGFTLASSPVMDLTEFENPRLEFNPWLCVQDPNVPAFVVLATNGTDTVVVDTIESDGMLGAAWLDVYEYDLAQYIAITDNVQIHFKGENEFGNLVVKAAFDRFVVTGNLVSSTVNIDEGIDFNVFPNPSSGNITVGLDASNATRVDRLMVYNNLGQVMLNQVWPQGQMRADATFDWPAGLYVITLQSEGMIIGTRKLIVD